MLDRTRDATQGTCFTVTDPAPPEIYTLSLHDALPISQAGRQRRHPLGLGRTLRPAETVIDVGGRQAQAAPGRSEEHTSELQSRFELVCRLLLEKKNLRINITSGLLTSKVIVFPLCLKR